MGIYNRDYIRDSSSPRSFGFQEGSVCKWLIIINVAVYVLQLFTQSQEFYPGFGYVRTDSLIVRWFELSPNDIIDRFQIWRLVTYAFCHDERETILHLVFNMLFVWWFGRVLEGMFGSREFLLFYLVSAAFAGLCYLVVGLIVGRANPAIGASGAVMAIMMVYAIYFPRQTILLMFIIPVQIRWLVAFYVVYDLWPVLQNLGGMPVADGVAHSAHLGGLLFGWIYKKNDIRLERFTANWRMPRFRRLFGPRRKLRVYHPEERREQNSAGFEARVDAILAKIHEHGEASLTDEERETLKQASRRYRKR